MLNTQTFKTVAEASAALHAAGFEQSVAGITAQRSLGGRWQWLIRELAA